jgi:hypothetical protein
MKERALEEILLLLGRDLDYESRHKLYKLIDKWKKIK